MTLDAKQSFGLELYLRMATGVDAVKASLTRGAGEAQIVFRAKTGGAAGNAIRVAILSPGSNSDTIVSVVGNDISITAGYTGSAIDATVNELISAIYASSAASALIDATSGAGDGTAAVAAAAIANLTGGADATHTYELIEGVGDVTLPGENREAMDKTSHSSPQARAEYLKSKVKEGPDLSFPLFFDPTNAVHAALQAAESSDDEVNMKFIYPESLGGFTQDILVLDIQQEYKVRGMIMANVKTKMTGPRVAL